MRPTSQTLVLAIFMGGMAIGSWICSRYSGRWGNLLLGYAATEGIIGLCALIFHTAFAGTIEYAYSTLIPQLGSPAMVGAFKWSISTLMILPQSILLWYDLPAHELGAAPRISRNAGEIERHALVHQQHAWRLAPDGDRFVHL